MKASDGHPILLVGLGNIGSFLALLLARNPAVTRIVLVDFDVVEGGNVFAQVYDAGDVEIAKVDAMAAKLRRVRPDLEVVVFRGEVEDLPLGWFRGLVVLALDSNGPRRVAARRSALVGGRLVDCAVNGSAGLARVTELGTDPEAACLECGWPPETYQSLPARHSCAKVPATNAPAALGTLAASIAVIRLLAAEGQGTLAETCEIVSTGAETFRSVIPRNPDCRFDHERIEVDPLRGVDFDQTIGSLFDRLQVDALRLPGFDWTRKIRCERCAKSSETLRVARGPVPEICGRCGGGMVRVQFYDVRGALMRETLTRDELSRTLAEAGLEPGDVLLPASCRRGALLGDPFAPGTSHPTQSTEPTKTAEVS